MQIKHKRPFAVHFFLLLSVAGLSGAGVAQITLYDSVPAKIFPADAKLVSVDSNFTFTEGPATDKAGNIFFTDQPNNNIWKYDTAGKLSLFMHNTGRSNGMYFDAAGNLIACADENNELVAITPGRKITVLVHDYKGHRLNGPNDVWISPAGNFYFTDPYYQRDYWKRTKPDSALGGEFVYCFLPGKKILLRADSTTIKPNGITGTPDGKYLYVADMGKQQTFRYNIQSDGSLKNKELFIKQASDGMTIDNKGNLYLTGDGVTVYNVKGEKTEHIPVPEKWTANVCFGGISRSILFITASKSVYILSMQVKGVE